jgi:membrane protein DedA with SNARE-associated domain/membrane-associated phospholipid phosphatase
MSGLLHGIADLASPWGYIIIGCLATGESAAFIGLAFPGETAMLLGGFLANQGNAKLGVMIVVAAAGAIIGDSIGYEIGRHLGPSLRRSRLGRRVGEPRWKRGEDYLRAKGGRAVFFGRWVGVLRALVPTLAGMARMRYRTFLPWNAAGGILWASAFVVLGYVAGNSYDRIGRIAGRAGLLLLILFVLAAVLVLGARAAIRRRAGIVARWQRQLERPRFVRARERYRRQLNFTANRLRPSGALGLWFTVGLLAIVATGWAFGALAEDVVSHNGLARIDPRVTSFMVNHTSPWMTHTMRVVTFLGGVPWTMAVAVAGVVVALILGKRAIAVMLIIAVAGSTASQYIVKLLVARPRPPFVPLTHPVGSSFPSGHAAAAAALYGSLALFFAGASHGWRSRVWIWTAATAVAVLIAFSRVYLRVHYLTDVLGGLVIGSLWVAVAATSARLVQGRHDRLR